MNSNFTFIQPTIKQPSFLARLFGARPAEHSEEDYKIFFQQLSAMDDLTIMSGCNGAAYSEGLDAGLRGLSEVDNPYRTKQDRSLDAAKWLSGLRVGMFIKSPEGQFSFVVSDAMPETQMPESQIPETHEAQSFMPGMKDVAFRWRMDPEDAGPDETGALVLSATVTPSPSSNMAEASNAVPGWLAEAKPAAPPTYYYLQPGDALEIGDEYRTPSGWKVLTEAEFTEWASACSHYWPEQGMVPFRRPTDKPADLARHTQEVVDATIKRANQSVADAIAGKEESNG